MTKSEPCLSTCKFKTKNTDDKPRCSLYEVDLESRVFKDEFDCEEPKIMKCTDCMEKELSDEIDQKIMDVISFNESYMNEVRLLMDELIEMVEKRRSIYDE